MSAHSARPKSIAAGQLVTGGGIYGGFSLRETVGATAVVQLFDNTAGSGTLVATIALAANSSKDFVPPDGIWFTSGLFAVITGTVEGSIYIA